MNISIVVLTHRRYKDLDAVLNAWLSETPDVWLCDCGPGYKTSLPVNIVHVIPDCGSKARHAVANLTSGDFVIKADDDVMPLPGFIKDIHNGWAEAGSNGICGIIGRRFNGESYYRKTSFCASYKVDKIQKVDFVGVITFSPREYLAFDLKDCQTPVEDLYWQMKAFPEVPKYVVPTKRYKNLESSNDSGCLFHNEKAREIREIFYKEYYLKNYRELK